jgi:hypothetical protein
LSTLVFKVADNIPQLPEGRNFKVGGMEHLDFIIWMTLFPVSVSICSYIDTVKNRVKGEEKKYSKKTEGYSRLIIVIIWLLVGVYLF